MLEHTKKLSYLDSFKLSKEELSSYEGIIYFDDGTLTYVKNGEYHREDGPAVVRLDHSEEWWREGKLHRLGGPAVTNKSTYWVYGKPCSKETHDFLVDLLEKQRIILANKEI